MTRPLKWPWSKALKVYLPKSDPASRLSKQGPAERDMSHSPQRVGVLTSHLFASSCRSFKSPTLPFIVHEGILSSPHLSGNKCLLSALPPFGSAVRDVIVLWKATHRRHASDNLIGCGKYLPGSNYSPPSVLRATACWVNRREINEQCASGRGWKKPLMGAQSDDMYL